jgi:hypothetical protein
MSRINMSGPPFCDVVATFGLFFTGHDCNYAAGILCPERYFKEVRSNACDP